MWFNDENILIIDNCERTASGWLGGQRLRHGEAPGRSRLHWTKKKKSVLTVARGVHVHPHFRLS